MGVEQLRSGVHQTSATCRRGHVRHTVHPTESGDYLLDEAERGLSITDVRPNESPLGAKRREFIGHGAPFVLATTTDHDGVRSRLSRTASDGCSHPLGAADDEDDLAGECVGGECGHEEPRISVGNATTRER